MDDENNIKSDYMQGIEARVHAIERLQALGLVSQDAEKVVEIWDEQKKKVIKNA